MLNGTVLVEWSKVEKIYLSCARRYVFNVQETEENIRLAKFKKKWSYFSRKIDNIVESKEKLILFLGRNKFEYIQTVSNVWKDAFKLSIKINHLFILFQKKWGRYQVV